MRWLAGVALATLAGTVLYVGLWEWVRSGTAPQLVAWNYDRVLRLFGPDPHSRCFLPAVRSNGYTILDQRESRDCYDWQPARLFSGIYIGEFEGQRFLEGATPARRYTMRDKVWLAIDRRTQLGPLATMRIDDGKTRVWYVRFSGRKTARPGAYGHFGMSKEEVVVDRFLQAHLVASFDNGLPDGMLVGDPQLR